MSDDKLLKARTDGSRAQSLINDELLQDAFTTLKRTYSDKLLATTIDQGPARETLYQAHRLVGEIQRHLQRVLDDGKIAEAELNQMVAAQQAKRGLFR